MLPTINTDNKISAANDAIIAANDENILSVLNESSTFLEEIKTIVMSDQTTDLLNLNQKTLDEIKEILAGQLELEKTAAELQRIQIENEENARLEGILERERAERRLQGREDRQRYTSRGGEEGGSSFLNMLGLGAAGAGAGAGIMAALRSSLSAGLKNVLKGGGLLALANVFGDEIGSFLGENVRDALIEMGVNPEFAQTIDAYIADQTKPLMVAGGFSKLLFGKARYGLIAQALVNYLGLPDLTDPAIIAEIEKGISDAFGENAAAKFGTTVNALERGGEGAFSAGIMARLLGIGVKGSIPIMVAGFLFDYLDMARLLDPATRDQVFEDIKNEFAKQLVLPAVTAAQGLVERVVDYGSQSRKDQELFRMQRSDREGYDQLIAEDAEARLAFNRLNYNQLASGAPLTPMQPGQFFSNKRSVVRGITAYMQQTYPDQPELLRTVLDPNLVVPLEPAVDLPLRSGQPQDSILPSSMDATDATDATATPVTPAIPTGNDLLQQGLELEGIEDPVFKELARSIFHQETSSGTNARPSSAGAIGPMQILPGTFNEVADPGMDINNPLDNMRAGIRYLLKGYKAAEGDPMGAAAFYYGGGGGLQSLSDPGSDPRPASGGPTVSEYASQVVNRMQAQASQNIQQSQAGPMATGYVIPNTRVEPMVGPNTVSDVSKTLGKNSLAIIQPVSNVTNITNNNSTNTSVAGGGSRSKGADRTYNIDRSLMNVVNNRTYAV